MKLPSMRFGLLINFGSHLRDLCVMLCDALLLINARKASAGAGAAGGAGTGAPPKGITVREPVSLVRS